MNNIDFAIIEKYPEVFGAMPFDSTTSLMEYGFECGSGWTPILEDLFEKISFIVKRDNLINFRVLQVKEKFGDLRIYTDNSTEEIKFLIMVAEKLCSVSCSECGELSSHTTKCGSPDRDQAKRRWISNLCEKCSIK